MSKNHNEDLMYQPINSRRYAAFPWMVVELKPESGNEQECIRQATKASHTSLRLCERLAAPANRDASPIVAFTSVGSKVKVFIAYKSNEDVEDEVYIRPPLPKSSIQPAKKFLFSVCLVYGAGILNTFCMPCNFDVLLVSRFTGH